MIDVVKIRELNLHQPIHPGRPAFVSAASGLVRVGGHLYVVADDENHLAVFKENTPAPGDVLTLFEGHLPVEKDARKKSKPDLEALTLLPAHVYPPHGALLAVPSGSKPNRRMGALVPLDSTGLTRGEKKIADFTAVYTFLEDKRGELNIEAAAVLGDEVYLLNRGNKKIRGNALICFNLKSFVASATNGVSLADGDLIRTCPLDLGELNGVPLTPTDAIALDGGQIFFTAAAEATENSYDDGACHGSAVGLMDLFGNIQSIQTVNTRRKLEGIDARRAGDRIELLLVNDEDSHEHPSELLRAIYHPA